MMLITIEKRVKRKFFILRFYIFFMQEIITQENYKRFAKLTIFLNAIEMLFFSVLMIFFMFYLGTHKTDLKRFVLVSFLMMTIAIVSPFLIYYIRKNHTDIKWVETLDQRNFKQRIYFMAPLAILGVIYLFYEEYSTSGSLLFPAIEMGVSIILIIAAIYIYYKFLKKGESLHGIDKSPIINSFEIVLIIICILMIVGLIIYFKLRGI
jgi:hypothetical protein